MGKVTARAETATDTCVDTDDRDGSDTPAGCLEVGRGLGALRVGGSSNAIFIIRVAVRAAEHTHLACERAYRARTPAIRDVFARAHVGASCTRPSVNAPTRSGLWRQRS